MCNQHCIALGQPVVSIPTKLTLRGFTLELDTIGYCHPHAVVIKSVSISVVCKNGFFAKSELLEIRGAMIVPKR